MDGIIEALLMIIIGMLSLGNAASYKKINDNALFAFVCFGIMFIISGLIIFVAITMKGNS